MDPFGPFGLTSVRTAPTAPTTATALTLGKTSHWKDNDGAALVAPFNLIIRRAGQYPDYGTAEEVRVTSYDSTGVLVMTRAQNGTTALSIQAGDEVYPSLNNPLQQLKYASPAMVSAAAYIFTPQTVGGSLGVGSNTITLSPVPKGINGSDTNHYVYISGGTGTAEPCLITSGTAVSGAITGTLTITCGNTHSGSWTVATASGGIVEAFTHTTNALVVLGPSHVTYKRIVLPVTCPGIIGLGRLFSIVRPQFTAESVFVPAVHDQFLLLRDFSVIPAATMTAGGVFDCNAKRVFLTAENLWFGVNGVMVYRGIICDTANGDCFLSNVFLRADFKGVTVCSFASLNNVHVVNERTQSTYLSGSMPFEFIDVAGLTFNGLFSDAGWFETAMYMSPSSAAHVNEVMGSTFYSDRWGLRGIYCPDGGSFNKVIMNGVILHDLNTVQPASYAILVNNPKCWQVTGLHATHGQGFGAYFVGGEDVLIDGMIYPSGSDVGTPGAAVWIDSTGTPKRFTFRGRYGEGFEKAGKSTYGIHCANASMDGLTIDATVKAVLQVNVVSLTGTESNVSIKVGDGIGNVRKTVAAAATTTFPVMCDDDVIEITGATGMATAVAGLREGQKGVMVWTDALPGPVAQVATIASPGFNPTQFKPYAFMFSNGKLYVG